MNDKKSNFYLTTTPIKKLLLKFSIPCVLGMLVSSLYNIVDQIFIGNSTAGTAGIMATTIVFPFTVIALALSLLIGDGCAALFSISLGSKDNDTAQKCVGNGIILVTVLSIILTIFGFIFMNPLLSLFGVNGYDANCQLFTKQYMTIILCGVSFFMFSAATSSIIRADGNPVYSMISTVIGAIINLIMDPILIFTFNMGIKGAALSTIVGQIASAIMCLLYFKKPKLINFTKDSFKLDKRVVSRIVQLGVSSLVTQISIAIITIVSNNVVGKIGGVNATDAGGALGIVFKIFGIVISFCIGISVGGQPIIGYNYGAKEYKRVLEAYKCILIANIFVGLIAMAAFELIPGTLVSIFGGHANDFEFYQSYAILCFRIYLGGILLCCIQKASCVFLQSIDKPMKSMILSLMRDVLLEVPCVCLFGLLGNLYTMLYAGPIADIGATIVTIIFVSIECKKIRKLANSDTNVKELINSSNNYIITIGREFGSGGKYIGQELAKRLNIKCYDKELLAKVADKYDINIELLKTVDEKQKNSFWYSFANNYVFGDNGELLPVSANDNLFLKQARVIEDLYNTENCIIIGRCSNFVLKDKPNVINIFIYASDIDFKINRKKEFAKMSIKKAKTEIEKIDRNRKDYYDHFTSLIWGDRSSYDICVDTSKLGVDNTINLLENYIKSRNKKNK